MPRLGRELALRRSPRSARAVTVFLASEGLLALIEDLGVGPIRNIGLLESAAARP